MEGDPSPQGSILLDLRGKTLLGLQLDAIPRLDEAVRT